MSMLASVDRLVEILEKTKVSYAIIGGVAVLLHGGRASTIDFDIYVISTDIAKLKAEFIRCRGRQELDGEHQVRFDVDGLKVDVLEADPILGSDLFRRCVKKRIVSTAANVASVEDLIVLKTLADRPIDRRDVEELREVFAGKIDEAYIQHKLKQFDL